MQFYYFTLKKIILDVVLAQALILHKFNLYNNPMRYYPHFTVVTNWRHRKV